MDRELKCFLFAYSIIFSTAVTGVKKIIFFKTMFQGGLKAQLCNLFFAVHKLTFYLFRFIQIPRTTKHTYFKIKIAHLLPQFWLFWPHPKTSKKASKMFLFCCKTAQELCYFVYICRTAQRISFIWNKFERVQSNSEHYESIINELKKVFRLVRAWKKDLSSSKRIGGE